MKTLKKLALIAVLVIMTSGAFANQALNFIFTDPYYAPTDTYTITADLFYNGTLYSNICTNATVYPVPISYANIFPFSVPADVEKNVYMVRVTLAKNGYTSYQWLWYSPAFNTDFWFNNNIVFKVDIG